MSEYQDEVLHHEYDGIREYDNPMPSWWSAIFLGTVIWAFFYVVAIGLGYVWDYGDSLRHGERELLAIREAHRRLQPPLVVNDALLAQAVSDPARTASGQEVFAASCAACHGEKGQGMIGPNLADDHWIYGGQMMRVHKVIHEGTPKGMPGWGAILTPQQVVDVVAFVRTLRGTNPPGAKAPQGKIEVPADLVGDENPPSL